MRVALVLVLLAAGGAATASGAAAVAPVAGARLLSCRQSPQIDQRVAVVSAWMKPLPAAKRLSLKIELQQRQLPGGRWTLRSDVPGLGAWTAPSDTLVGSRAGDVFRYRQAVGRLVVGSAYRFRVSFRWQDDSGAIAREATVTTRACRQPDLRPDLVPTSVQAAPAPAGGGLVRYAVTVVNAGRSTSPRTVLAATYPGETTPGGHRHRVPRLAPGASAVIAFTGPGCRAGEAPATFVVDPLGTVEEAGEANNQLAAACPAP